jgi:hypothetical protein
MDALQGVLELAHVAGQGWRARRSRRRRRAAGPPADPRGHARDEDARELRQVGRPRAQRRDEQGDDRQAEVEVLAEAPGLDLAP